MLFSAIAGKPSAFAFPTKEALPDQDPGQCPQHFGPLSTGTSVRLSSFALAVLCAAAGSLLEASAINVYAAWNAASAS
jgi:hypothetical protein